MPQQQGSSQLLMNWFNSLKTPQTWILAIAAILAIQQVYLTDKFEQVELLGTSLLAWGASFFLIWEKRPNLSFQSNLFTKCFGLTLLALVFWKHFTLSEYEAFLRLSPIISGIGLGLVASGFKGLKQYWQELLILCFPILSPAPAFLHEAIKIAPVTAVISGLLLWYLGFPVSREGVLLHLPTGSVEVGSGCSGLSVIMQLLGLAMLVLFMFPTNLKQKILVPLVAIFVGFTINCGRVALMAFLVAYSSPKSFEYWHFGEGSLIFSMIAVLIFGLICWFGIIPETPKKQDVQ